jgi:signal transduction histidine kinase
VRRPPSTTEPLELHTVLAAVREATEGVGKADHSDEALTRLVQALVPQVGDAAEIFVMAAGGGLQARARAPVTADRSPDSEGPATAGDDPEHPAAVAIRSGAATGVPDGGRPVTLPTGSEVGSLGEFRGVALPLFQEDQAVGALLLTCGNGRHYRGEDLELLRDIGGWLSQALDNRRLRREVRAARRAKSDFLAVMNHELRTPLTAVVGYADLLEAGIPGPVTDKQRRQLIRIKESAWDLLELIDGILGYARYEGERPELTVRKVQPEVLLSDAVRLVESSALEKGLTVAVEALGPLPAFPTDLEKARRVLFHLLSNAVKFTPEGEVRVRISSDEHWVSFSIADTGIGIRPEERQAIFEPFWQGEQIETRTTRGVGMGLSLAQKLTELLSGEIDVDSELGRGSTFTVRLPREGPHAAIL